MNEVQKQLEALHLAESEYDAVEANLKSERDGKLFDLLGEDLYTRFQEIKADYDVLLEQAMTDRERVVKELQAQIKTGTLAVGETVKGQHNMAVFVQPSPAWDNKKLEGFALVHPAVLECRTEKPPYVSIRKVK